MIELHAPATGERLGAVETTAAAGLPAVLADISAVQPYWAHLRVEARARAVRRMALGILDDLDDLALALAREAGRPRTEIAVTELLPTVSALDLLSDEGPRVLGEERIGLPALLRAGRRARLLRAPLGVAGVEADPASPWAASALEVAAAIVAGNGVVLASAPRGRLAAERLRAVAERAGVPPGLVRVVHLETGARLDGPPLVVRPPATGPGGAIVALADAPVAATVAGALWAAFGGAGRGAAAAGRLVVTREVAHAITAGMTAGAERLRLGDPARPETEVGPLSDRADLDHLKALVADAVDRGAELLCGGPASVAGLSGAFFAPAVLRGVPADAPLLQQRVPGPLLAVIEVRGAREAIEACADMHVDAVASVWASDRRRADRVARALPARLVWMNEHGAGPPSGRDRLLAHTRARQLSSRPAALPAVRRYPADLTTLQAATSLARVLHGREADRAAAVRAGARPLTRIAGRTMRALLER